VTVPEEVPTTIKLAPGIGCPLSSTTDPEIVVCEYVILQKTTIKLGEMFSFTRINLVLKRINYNNILY
jgi:hypothetical protein